MYLSLYCKGSKRVSQRFTVGVSWRLNKDCNILTSSAPPDIAVYRSRSPGLLNRGPGGPASLGHVFIPASSHQLVLKLNRGTQKTLVPGSGFLNHILSLTRLISNSPGVPRAPSAGWWLSLPHLVSNFSGSQLTNFLYSPSYIIVQSPTQSPTQSLEWHV